MGRCGAAVVTGYDYLRAGLHHVGADQSYHPAPSLKRADPADAS